PAAARSRKDYCIDTKRKTKANHHTSKRKGKLTMDRREFIKATTSSAIAVTTAGLTTAGMTANSYARVIGANELIRLGGIVPGDRGAGRVATAQKLGADIVALADVNKGMLELAQKKLTGPVEKTYVDYNDLLARKDIDGVIIAVPDHLHHDVLL